MTTRLQQAVRATWVATIWTARVTWVASAWTYHTALKLKRRPTKGAVVKALIGMVALFLVIQLVPYGRNHTNPPVRAEPAWDSARTRELAKVACFDCHSNETVWPWYSSVAPVSWLTVYDVERGRDELNFSEWPNGSNEDIAESLDEGMPPWFYIILHPDALLLGGERRDLKAGLRATFGR